MNFGRRTPAPEALRIVHRALELGVRVFDTANAYENGESERILGAALRGRPEEVVIATKVGLRRVRGEAEGLSAATIQKSVEESRVRLGRASIDVLYLHQPDPQTPFDETLNTVNALIADGKMSAWGMSNFASWQILEAIHLADAIGLARPRIGQYVYNLLIRELEIEFFAFASRFGVHTTVYNPLAGGLLTNGLDATRFRSNKLYQQRYFSERLRAEASAYAAVATDVGLSLSTLALQFLAATTPVDSVILGPATLAQLEDAVLALGSPLSPEGIALVNARHRAYLGTTTHYARPA